MGLDKNKHLECVISSHNIENNEDLIKKYRKKRDEVKEALEEKYAEKIFTPINSGSYKKRTAVNIKFDMDIIVPYKKDSDTLENIFNDLFKFFDEDYRKKDSTLIGVKKQRVSIGLEFLVDSHVLYLDIVPGREIDDYPKDGNLNLYVNETMGILGKSSYIKSNIQKQIDYIRDHAESRESIKLLKVWKRRNNSNGKSFFYELITIRSIKDHTGDFPTAKWDRLKYTLEYIRDNVKTVRLEDPGNSNNIVSDSLAGFEKQGISDAMKWMLDDIEKNENALEKYFPVNPDYPCSDDKSDNSDKYIIGSTVKPDKLNNNDFGCQ